MACQSRGRLHFEFASNWAYFFTPSETLNAAKKAECCNISQAAAGSAQNSYECSTTVVQKGYYTHCVERCNILYRDNLWLCKFVLPVIVKNIL